MIYRFNAYDPASDKGQANVVILADSLTIALNFLYLHQDTLNRDNLNFVLRDSIPTPEAGVIYSDLERR